MTDDDLRVAALFIACQRERDLLWRAYIGKREDETLAHAKALADAACELQRVLGRLTGREREQRRATLTALAANLTLERVFSLDGRRDSPLR